MGLWSDDIGFWILALLQQLITVEKTTFITMFGHTYSLWDIDLFFGVVVDLIILFIPTVQPDDSDGGIYRKTKL